MKKQNSIWIYPLMAFGFILILTNSCKKDDTNNSTKKSQVPILTTSTISGITQTTANCGGNITSDGGATITARGVCWSTSANPIITNNKTMDGTGKGEFASNLTGLTAHTLYYVRAYATNGIGTAYGSQASFTSSPVPSVLSTVTTASTSSITTTAATSGGNVTNDGGATVTNRGVCWSTSENPTIANSKTTDGTGTGAFASSLTGLIPNTLYYVKAYATNLIGTAYGAQVSFTTAQVLIAPTAITNSASFISQTGATLNSSVNANNQSTTVTFEYGTTTTYGQSIIATPNTISGSTNTDASASLTGLMTNTTYHYRVKAVNSSGTTYGSDVLFTTMGSGIIFNPNLTYGSVSDYEGNTYKTILIGTQTWMAENLKVTKYRNGDLIGTTTLDISDESTPKYQWAYGYDESKVATYGRLYTWYAVTDIRNVCPTGWNVPTDAEWTTLITYLGGESIAGGKLKEIGTTHWASPNTYATNASGFTALPGGFRYFGCAFIYFGEIGQWWSKDVWSRSMESNNAATDNNGVYREFWDEQDGYSVRCIKD